jgi:hypothetical protein
MVIMLWLIAMARNTILCLEQKNVFIFQWIKCVGDVEDFVVSSLE